MRTIAVYSDADANALHVRCDEALSGRRRAREYLMIEPLIEAARTARNAFIRATGFCPRKPNSRKPARKPALCSSVRRRMRSAPWA